MCPLLSLQTLAELSLVISDLPPMILTKEGEEYSAVEGKGVTMHCRVFSSPPSTISWYELVVAA